MLGFHGQIPSVAGSLVHYCASEGKINVGFQAGIDFQIE
jgi:hypothetical protein